MNDLPNDGGFEAACDEARRKIAESTLRLALEVDAEIVCVDEPPPVRFERKWRALTDAPRFEQW